ncbi:MAG: exo-alpha-sialidase [Candidatus Hydrogenedentes bacterium]|nr:exo-alpha-sialidase [Candidatus Hydrogenedentota bacterium]
MTLRCTVERYLEMNICRVLISVASLTFAALALDLREKAGPIRIESLDGRAMTIENFGERAGTAILFLSSRSQAIDAAADDINRIHQMFRLKDVLFVGVCSSPDVTGEELRIYAQERGMVFPIYRDPSGAVAQSFKATVLPEVFLLDRQGVILYKGALLPDNGKGGVEAAITDLLANRPVAVTNTTAHGDALSEKRPSHNVEDPYATPWFASELLFEKIPGAPAHHCSTLAQAANGDLLCVWYGGSYESADDQALFISRRKVGQRVWSDPAVLLSNPGQPPGNALIFNDGHDRLWVVWGRMESTRPLRRGSGWGQCRLFTRISNDNGLTWSADKEWPDSFGQLPRNAPVTLATGELLLPLSGHIGDKSGAFFMITKDYGATWQRSNVIPNGSQPTVAQRDDGSLLTLMRHEPRLLSSESNDGGRTWSPPAATDIKNPDAGIALRRLFNGHFVLVFNDTDAGRTPLSIMRSTDGGKSWESPLKLEDNPGEYSYPCVIQTTDGRIQISYTFRRYSIKHVELDEDWITQTKRPN